LCLGDYTGGQQRRHHWGWLGLSYIWPVGNKVKMVKARNKERYVIDGWADLTKVTNKPNSVCYNHMFSINIMQNFESFLVSRYFELNFL
jgi:hypothetical protein